MTPFKPTRKNETLLSVLNNTFTDLPAPQNLSTFWNFGSLLGLCLSIQILSGVMLAMYYTPHTFSAFESIEYIYQETNMGWMMRNAHANGASAFFLCLYLHIARGMYYGSYHNSQTWNIGVTMLILSMATAFMGYLLPWGQMSFWGATVISSMFSAIPYMGPEIVQWLWGGFSVNNATLNRFFALHFMAPFILAFFSIIHLTYLHKATSSNPLGLTTPPMKVPFHNYYSFKDLVGVLVLTAALLLILSLAPNIFSDPENFTPANSLATPTHIKPEWYFLWAYTILRSIPNKLGGVIAMIMAILILYAIPILAPPQRTSSFNPKIQLIMWLMMASMLMLTWIGGCPVESPYEQLGKIATLVYFSSFLILYLQSSNRMPNK